LKKEERKRDRKVEIWGAKRQRDGRADERQINGERDGET
jgi:hypothetical protein